MTDIDLQFIETLEKDCLQNGTWAEPISSSCELKVVIETSAKVCICYFCVKEFNLYSESTKECFTIYCNGNNNVKQLA